MANTRTENAVRSLVNLYTVVIGVALSLAVVTLMDAQKGLSAVTPTSILLFIAFIATLFPFYHGALRHLDDVYIENDHTNVRDGALMIDFILLFLHALAFVVLSLLLNKPADFAWLLIAVLAIDVVWGVFAHFSAPPGKRGATAAGKWTIINFFFVMLSAVYLVSQGMFLNYAGGTTILAILIALACILRTVVDYLWCRSFYFPH